METFMFPKFQLEIRRFPFQKPIYPFGETKVNLEMKL